MIKSNVCLALLCTLVPLSISSPISSLIYGGVEAIPGEFPWVVSLQIPADQLGNFDHSCGGTLISSKRVVTTADCAHNLAQLTKGSIPRIAAGGHNVARPELQQQYRYFNSSSIHIHPLFNHSLEVSFYDIAVIDLDEELSQTDRINWIKLPSAQYNPPTIGTCQIMGWGQYEGYWKSDVLRKANVTVWLKTNCKTVYADYFNPETQICAGSTGVDFCMGDTGGPIVCRNEGDEKIFAGISSYNYLCGQFAGKPGVYIEVSKFLDFIEDPNDEVEKIYY